MDDMARKIRLNEMLVIRIIEIRIVKIGSNIVKFWDNIESKSI